MNVNKLIDDFLYKLKLACHELTDDRSVYIGQANYPTSLNDPYDFCKLIRIRGIINGVEVEEEYVLNKHFDNTFSFTKVYHY